MRLGFAGTPEFAAAILRGLINGPHEVARILSQPARLTGRGRKLLMSAVEQEANRHGIVCHTPTDLRGHEDLVADVDLLVVAAYGMILPPEIFGAPRFASLNVHASLLPRWRGAAPIERAIMAGDGESGISIMQIEAALDTGPILAFARYKLIGDETGASLSRALALLGSTTLNRVLNDWTTLPTAAPQDHHLATYAHKLAPTDSFISWTSRAIDIERVVRALSGRNAAYAQLGASRIRILKAKVLAGSANPGELIKTSAGFAVGCGDGLLLLNTIQMNRGQGKAMSADEAANGHPDLFAVGIQYDVIA